MEPITWEKKNTPRIGKKLIFDAKPNPISTPANTESRSLPFLATRYRKNRVHTAKRDTKVSKAKKFDS